MAEICFLGTGGSVPTSERDNTAFLIHYRDEVILVDCPGSVFQKIIRAGLDPRRVKSIVVTHVHPDHIYGLPSFVHSLMLDSLEIKLYGSKETVQFCQRYLDLFHLREEKIKCRVKLITVNPEDHFRLAPSLLCQAFSVPHHSSSLAFYLNFEEDKKDLLYSGDTPVFVPLFKRASGVDLLIHDCSAPSRFFKEYPALNKMHTSSLDLGRFSQQAGVKCLAPCHFFGEVDYSMTEIEDEIRKNYTGALVIPDDLTKISL